MRTLIVAAALATAAACTSPLERQARTYAHDSLAVAQAERAGFAIPAPAVQEHLARTQSAVSSDGTAPLPRADVTANMVIRTGQTSIEVDSLERAVSQVRLLAGRIGGYVANTTVQTGHSQLRSATLEVKIPADRFDDGLGGLAGLGKVESVNVNAEDVGEEFTDVTARMGNARRLESRLIDLLATRTGKLKDVLDVEQQLARVREEIERYEGRLRYLHAHAVLSTLTIYVHEPLPVVGRAGSSVIGEAFKQAWRNFVALVAACIRGLGIVIPLGVVATAGWLSLRRWQRARSLRTADA